MTTEPVGFVLFGPQSDEAFATRMTTVRREAIQRAADKGYRFWFRVMEARRPMPDVELSREVHVEAHSDGRRCGNAKFTETNEGCFYAQETTSVIETHRGNGLADAMYAVAEVVAGQTLYNFWGNMESQSEDGQRLWKWSRKDGRVRPFGPREDRERGA